MFASFEFRLGRSGHISSVLLIFSCFQLFSGFQAIAQLPSDSVSLFYSEAPVFFENGVKKSNALTVKFKDRVINLPQGVTQASPYNIDPSFSSVIQFFDNLESKYQDVTLSKQIPSAVWGDTIRISQHTGRPVKIHDMSQLFWLQFSQFVPIDSIIQNLEQLPEVEYAHQPIQAVSFAQPHDPSYNSTDQWNLFKVNAAAAWDITKGSSNVIVGIIDAEGVNRNHVDFSNTDGSNQFIDDEGDLLFNGDQ